MSSGITNELDDLAKSFKLYRFNGELNYYTSQNDNINNEKIEALTKVIAVLDGKQDTKNEKNKTIEALNEMSNMVYKKTWRRIPNFHKNIKIKEYLSERFKDINYSYIENMISSAIENNEFNNEENVIYDQKICKIIDIPALKQDQSGKYILTQKCIVKRKKKQVPL